MRDSMNFGQLSLRKEGEFSEGEGGEGCTKSHKINIWTNSTQGVRYGTGI